MCVYSYHRRRQPLNTNLCNGISVTSQTSKQAKGFNFEVKLKMREQINSRHSDPLNSRSLLFRMAVLPLLVAVIIGAVSAQVLRRLMHLNQFLGLNCNKMNRSITLNSSYLKDTYSCPDGWHISDIGDEVVFY